jgi:hypothetical protein
VRRIARVAAITAIATVATVVSAAAPAYAGTFGTLDFGTVPVGSSSAPLSASIPLTTTVGAVRTQLAAAIDATTFTDINLVLVVVTADEQRRVAQDALAASPTARRWATGSTPPRWSMAPTSAWAGTVSERTGPRSPPAH